MLCVAKKILRLIPSFFVVCHTLSERLKVLNKIDPKSFCISMNHIETEQAQHIFKYMGGKFLPWNFHVLKFPEMPIIIIKVFYKIYFENSTPTNYLDLQLKAISFSC